MNKFSNTAQLPVLIGERVIDDRYAKYGKGVVERDFKMPDGKVLPMICITSPQMNPIIIFAVTCDKEVLLVNQFRFATNELVCELPGGCPKPGQNWEDVATAELMEEVGAEALEMKVIGKPIPFNPALQDCKFTAVLATGCRIVKPQTLDEGEQMTVMKIDILHFRKMLKEGEITDAKTIATGYLALDHLGLL